MKLKNKSFKIGLFLAVLIAGVSAGLVTYFKNIKHDAKAVNNSLGTYNIQKEANSVGTYDMEKTLSGGGTANAFGQRAISIMRTDDGKTVFCIDPSRAMVTGNHDPHPLVAGVELTQFGDTLTDDQLTEIKKIVYRGWDSNQDKSLENYAYTQLSIWKALGWRITNLSEGVDLNGLFRFENVHLGGDGVGERYPSFAQDAKNTYKVKIGQSLFLNDEWNDFSKFNFSVPEGWNIVRENNGIRIEPLQNAQDTEVVFNADSGTVFINSNDTNAQRIAYITPYISGKRIRLQVDRPSNLKIIKKDNKGSLIAGVVFEVSPDQNFARDITELTTGQNGEIENNTFGVKTVYIREKSAPEHLIKSNEVKSVNLTAGTTQTVEFVNELKKNTLKIIKKDEGGHFVSGVVFEVAEDQNFTTGVKELTTGVNGEVSSNFDYAKKTLYIREKTVPKNLVKSQEVKTVSFANSQTATVEFVNKFQTHDISILKTDEEGNPVPGVRFSIRIRTVMFDDAGSALEETVAQQVVTDVKGLASLKYIYAGNFPAVMATITEISAPEHLVVSKEEKTVDLTPGGTSRVTFVNKLKEYPVDISKADLSSSAPIEGVTLTIYKADDKANTNKIYESVTDKTGKLKGLKLVRGKYKFIETHATIGYKINPNPHFFEVKDDGTIVGDTKMDDERQDYDFQVVKKDNKGNLIAGVVFSAKNKLTGEITKATTDDKGVAKFHGIWAEYEIREESAPEGLIKSDEVYNLDLKKDGTYQKLEVINKLIEIPPEEPKAPDTGSEKGNSGTFTVLGMIAIAFTLSGITAFVIKRKLS